MIHLGGTNAFLAAGLEEFEEKIEALGQEQEEEEKSETWISNLVKEYAKVNMGFGTLKYLEYWQIWNLRMSNETW